MLSGNNRKIIALKISARWLQAAGCRWQGAGDG
jgi:hypothetical protein